MCDPPEGSWSDTCAHAIRENSHLRPDSHRGGIVDCVWSGHYHQLAVDAVRQVIIVPDMSRRIRVHSVNVFKQKPLAVDPPIYIKAEDRMRWGKIIVSSPATSQPGFNRAAVTIRVLGRFAVYREGSPVTLRPSVRKLVALLAITEENDRADVASQLFFELPTSRAQGNLRTILWRLHDDFPDLVVEQHGCLHIQATSIDYQDVSQWSLAVVQRKADGLALPRHAGKDLLPSWGDHWLTEPREHLHVLQVHALEASAERFLLAGRFGEASDCAMRAAALDQLRESAVKLLIEVLIREENVAAALRFYFSFCERLRLEINAEPGFALRALVAPLFAAGYRNPTQSSHTRSSKFPDGVVMPSP